MFAEFIDSASDSSESGCPAFPSSVFGFTFLQPMTSDDRIRKNRKFRNPMLILGIVMTVFYVVLGALLLFSKDFLPAVGTDFRNIFAVMLIIYGIYRGWRVYADHYHNK